ncbi:MULTISPECIES: class A sortase [Enterococcus]|uniref:class A sortase n=1 Tax=Enterococcus TaxID=1350 RepID=UPI000CF1C108|nr:class A sortase [Enterococcus faecium]EGP4892442.1 class A sortase [Enterococcus faecium]EGP4915063.1 class A sortase [Enterococcus faecium]EGP5169241.1 class A sortase [Enterococcus faecium]MCL6148052.1 class A sortase [Enterococcus faecium]MCL6150608.1 class A sortase [Enterococcus faecium]
MKKILKLFSIIWLLIGFFIVGSTIYGYYLLQKTNNRSSVLSFPIQSEKQVEENQQAKITDSFFDPESIQPVHARDFANAQLRYEEIVNQSGIGSIYIPSSIVQTKILSGMSNDNLMVGVGTYRSEQRLGKGNYVLLAHNITQGGGVLNNIRQTLNGSLIYATDFSKIYEYRVTMNQVVNQAAGEVLNEPKANEKPLITLIRCEGGLYTDKRAVVQGELISSYSASKANNNLKENLGLISVVQDQEQSVNSSNAAEANSNKHQTNNIKKYTNHSENVNERSSVLKNKNIYSFFERYCIWLVKKLNDLTVLFFFSFVYISIFLFSIILLLNKL